MIRRVKILLTAITLLLGFAELRAFGPYDFSSETGTYNPLSSSATTLALTKGLLVSYANVPLPFPFTYNNVAFSNVFVTTNGYAQMASRISELASNFLNGSASNIIAPFATSLSASGIIKTELTGTSPNRVFTIQWENFHHATNTGKPYQNLNFQLKFNENNTIEFVYGSFSGISNGFSANVQVGLRGTALGDFVAREIAEDWKFTNDGGSAAATCYFDNIMFPQSGLKFSYGNLFVNQYRRNYATQQSGYVLTETSAVNTQMMRIIVRTEGSTLPFATASSFTFNTEGTTNPLTDINGAKLFYTGASSSFSTTTQFGNTINNPNGSFEIAATPIPLVRGNNYFWLAYDINTNLSNYNHKVKAQCNSMVINGASTATTPTSQPGGIAIKGMLAGIYQIGNSPNADYSNLSSAFKDINDFGLSGDVYFRIISDINDTTILSLPWAERGTGNYKVHIFPEGGDWNMSSNSAQTGFFNIAGAKNITIDGQFYVGGIPGTVPGDGQNHLSIHCDVNSSTLNPVFYLREGSNGSSAVMPARNITIKYCNIRSLNPASLNNVGIYINSATTAITDIRILNNRIWSCYNGISYNGNAANISLAVNIEIKNNIIGNDNQSISFNNCGIYIANAQNGIVDNNIIYNKKYADDMSFQPFYGIYIHKCSFDPSSRFEVTNNRVKNFFGDGFMYGIYVDSSHNTQISNNIVSDFTTNTGHKGKCFGIYVGQTIFDNLTLNSAIEKNKIYNLSGDYSAIGCYVNHCMKAKILANEIFSLQCSSQSTANGILASGMDNDTSRIIIANNVIYDLGAILATTYGVINENIWGMIISGGSEFYIYYNSISINNTFNDINRTTCGDLLISNISDTSIIKKVHLQNNIFASTKTSLKNVYTYNVYTLYSRWPQGDSANFTDNNIYWSSQGTTDFIGYAQAQPYSYRTLVSWQGFTNNQDAASQNVDPLFASKSCLIPLPGSPALSAGAPVFINTDFFGNPRNSTLPSIGAYEKPAQIITSPANNAVEVSYAPIVFSWVATANAVSFKIQVSTDKYFATNVVDQIVTTNSFSTTLQRVTIYYWRVSAFDANNDPIAYWSYPYMFTTGGPIDSPILVSPENLSIISLLGAELKWNPVFTAQTYTVQISTSNDFTTILCESSNLNTTTFQIPPVLLPNQINYWRVRAAKPAFTSDWSASRTFTTNSRYDLVETFDKTIKIPTGWTTNVLLGKSYWAVKQSLSNPYVSPHNANTAVFCGKDVYSNSISGEGILVSPCVDFRNRGENAVPVSFWVYRSLGYANIVDDRIDVYVNDAGDMVGTPVLIGSVARSKDGPPALGPKDQAGWYQYTFNVPSNFNGSRNYIIFKAINSGSENIYIDDISISTYPLANFYTNSITTQPASAEYPVFTRNKQILGVQISTEGMLNLKSATSFRFNTAGTTLPSDIKNAKLYYTETKPKFSTNKQYGQTVDSPNGEFIVNGDQLLKAGINYFWLCYDIDTLATIGNNVDAQFINFTIDGVQNTPTNPGTESIFTLRPLEVFDVLQQFDASEAEPYSTNDKFAAATDGNNVYTTSTHKLGSFCSFYRYDMNGSLLDTFLITLPNSSDNSTMMDLTYDGRYFWGGTNSNYDHRIYKMDFQANPPAIVGEIVLDTAVFTGITAIAYQPASGTIPAGFWVQSNGYGASLFFVNMLGEIVCRISAGIMGSPLVWDIKGLAFDNYSPGGPYLWINNNITLKGRAFTGPILYQIGNIYNGGVITNINRSYMNDLITLDYSDQEVQPTAGGLYTYLDTAAHVFKLGGLMHSSAYEPSQLFNLYLTSTAPMTYGSTRSEQKVTDYVLAGSLNQRMLDIRVVTNGNSEPLSVSNMTFNIAGTTNPADIVNAKIYFTGLNPVFSTDLLVGTFSAPTGNFTIDLSGLSLIGGINYFWLTYDISTTAENFNTLDAELNSLVIGNVTRIPVNAGAVVGNRTVLSPLSGDYTVGVGGDFPNLGKAFTAAFQVSIAGNTNFKIISDIVEPSTALAKGWANTSDPPAILKVFPIGEPRRIECYDTTVIKLLTVDNVIFDGSLEAAGTDRSLTIVNTYNKSGAACFSLLTGVTETGCGINNITIKNTIIQNSYIDKASYGIYAGLSCTQGSKNLTFENNHIFNTACGISVFQDLYYYGTDYSRDIKILNNKIGNENSLISLGHAGIELYAVRNPIGGTLPYEILSVIKGNEIFNITQSSDISGLNSNGASSVAGIYVYYCDGIDIKSNVIHDINFLIERNNSPSGITVTTSNGANIINNTISGISTIGISSIYTMPAGILISQGSYHNLYYNSVLMNGSYLGSNSGPFYSSALVLNFTTSQKITFLTLVNNLFANTMTSSQVTYSMAIYKNDDVGFFNGSPDYNDYFAPYIMGNTQSQFISNLAVFRELAGTDDNSISEEPALTSATNLMPTASSPLIFGGTQIFDVPTDITGAIRNILPTIGAYEYVNSDLLAPPISVFPINKSYGVENLPCTFRWKTVGQASRYDMQLTTDPQFAEENIILLENLGDTSVVYPLPELTRYYFRLRSKNETLTSPWSKRISFFSKGVLVAPILVSPENRATIFETFTFSWNEVIASNKYRIEIAQNPNFINSTIVDSTSSLSFNKLSSLPRGVYYWRVKAGNGVENSPWSEIRTFSYYPCEGVQHFNASATECNWETGSGQAIWTWTSGATYPETIAPHSSPGMASIYAKGSGSSALLISSKIDYSLRAFRPASVSFYMYRYAPRNNDQPDLIEVYVNTNKTTDGAVLLGSIHRSYNMSPIEVSPSHWSLYTMNIPTDYEGTENYIIFKGIYSGGYASYIDDVSVTEFFLEASLPVPILESPSNYQTKVSIRPKLRWNTLPFDGNVRDYSYNIVVTDNNTNVVMLDTIVNNTNVVEPILLSGTSYTWKVRSTDNVWFSAWSGEFIFTTINYCQSGSFICTDYTQYISSVSFGDMQNLNTACSETSQGYSDYSAMYATDTVGTSTNITATVANGVSSDSFGAWFDWNQNGSFNDAGEFFQLTSNDGGTTYTGTITVPENAAIGLCRMRLRVINNEDILVPCGSSSVGEVEDYSIKVIPVMPVINLTSIDPVAICAGQSIVVNFDVSVAPFFADNTYSVYANKDGETVLIGRRSNAATFGSDTINCNFPNSFSEGTYSISMKGYYYDIPVISNSTDLTVNALPIVYNVIGGGGYCAGGDGVVINLNGSETDAEYQLFRTFNGQSAPINNPVIGTGEALSLGIQTLEGTYYVVAKKTQSLCELPMNGTQSIVIYTNPLAFNVVGGGAYCEGSSGVQIGLPSSQSKMEYDLIFNGVVVEIATGGGKSFNFKNLYTANGRYTVVAVSSTGCRTPMNNYVDVTTIPASQAFTVSGGGATCETGNGVSINLSGSQENIIYKLYKNGKYVSGLDMIGTGSAIDFAQIKAPGTYSVYAVNGGCSTSMTGSATVESISTPQSFILSSPTNGHYCAGSATGAQLVLSGSQVGVNYEILLNGQFLTAVEGTDLPLTINNITLEGDYTVLAVNATTTCTRMMDGTVNVIIDALTVPTDGMPVGLNVDVNPAQFSWSLVDCASSYKLTVSTSQDFSDWVVNETIPAENLVLPFAVSGLANNTTYFWKVASENGELIVSSQAWSFTSSTGYPTQTIELPHGWSVISANVAPLNNSMPSIWQNIVDRLLIIKEGTGNFWMPPSTGSLSTWNSLNGYQVYITQPTTLSITGPQVPASTPIVMSSPGWYMVSYLPESPMQANQALSSIARQLVIAKNGLGEMYWPMFGVNNLSNSEGTMKPSFGYLIYVVNSAELVYPSNLSRISMINQFEGEPKVEFMKPTVERTGNSASMVLSIDNVSDGAEIALFNGNNEICGSGVVREGRAAITIWGDNSVTETREGAVENEMLTVKLYDKVSGKLSAIKLESVDELTRNSKGKTVNFVKDGLFVARGTANETNNELSVSCSPNPFNESTTISYEVVENAQVEVELFSLEGVKVASIASGWRNAGSYTAEYRNSDLSSGTYQLVLRSGTHTVSTMIVHVK